MGVSFGLKETVDALGIEAFVKPMRWVSGESLKVPKWQPQGEQTKPVHSELPQHL